MVVESLLVPLFRHFQKMVAVQQGANHARFTGGGDAEIVGQFQLAQIIKATSNQLLHDLQQHARGVSLQVTVGAVQHLHLKGA